MVKIYRYEFDPDLPLIKFRMTPVISYAMGDDRYLNYIHNKPCLSPDLREGNDLNLCIATPNHIWAPLCITFANPITDYDNRIVFQEDRDGS